MGLLSIGPTPSSFTFKMFTLLFFHLCHFSFIPPFPFFICPQLTFPYFHLLNFLSYQFFPFPPFLFVVFIMVYFANDLFFLTLWLPGICAAIFDSFVSSYIFWTKTLICLIWHYFELEYSALKWEDQWNASNI